jgi:hypothetical protein
VATANTSTATKVTTLADLYEKRNTDVKTGIKLITEEVDWFKKYPRENIVLSGNENRVPVLVAQPISPAMIPEGGNERVMSSPAPVHGTFMPVQMNARYGFTGLAAALDNRARAAMIENQTEFQALMTGYSFGRGVGLQTYGQSAGTLAVVKTTGSASATQVIPLKNAFGSATFVPGGDAGAQDTYLSSLPRVGDTVALIHTGAILEFGTVTAAPSASSGIGFIDVTFNSSITPTAGDLLVLANADGDNTINGTDVNNWSIGFTEILTAAALMGLTATNWVAGSVQTASQRLSFAVKQRMIDDCWNASGVKINRFIMPQGVRRDAITGQGGARRYDSADYDLEGDLEPGDGQQYFTSQLALPGTMIGWNADILAKTELSDLPDNAGASKSIFKLDKVQGKSQIAAVYDYFYQRICSSRGATGYATNLQSA